MENIIIRLLEIGGIPFLMLVIGFLAGRYIKPWIHKNQERLARAQEIAFIADRITDEMLAQFPGKPWTKWLDKAVDKLIRACDLKDAEDSRELARRELAYQIARKSGC